MIEVDKTYSDNPFVDELIYYSKILSLNCVIKDEEEALANETKESLHAGQTYIACVEGRAKFEMFESFPEEILEKYGSYPPLGTLAAHFDGDEYTDEELEEIKRFAEYIKSRRKTD